LVSLLKAEDQDSKYNLGVGSLAGALEVRMWSHSSIAEGNRGSIVALEGLLREVLSNIHPLEEDRVKRLNIITRFKSIVQGVEHLKGASVTPFGSFLSDLYTRWGDLDISIELPAASQSSTLAKHKKRKILSDLKQALLRGGAARYVQFIPTARVPLLIFEDPYSQISCDISINNGLGMLKSKFLYWISQIDTRFRELVFLIKYWAKAQNINDPKSGTLNSFSFSLLIIFHLQMQSPPILPPFKHIYNGDIARELAGGRNTDGRQIEEECKLNVEKFKRQGFGRDNKSTISELFVSFFAQYTQVAGLWSQGLTVCTFTGKWGNASSNDCRIKKKYAMTIEDPFDHVENCARSVTESTLRKICDEFSKTEQSLHRLPMPSEMHSLHRSLFGSSQEGPKPRVIPTRVNSVNSSRKLDADNPNKRGSLQGREMAFYNRSVESTPSVVPSRVISANVPSRVISANTTRKPGESNRNKGVFSQQLGNTSSNIRTKIEPPNSLAATFSRSCSLSESMPYQPAVASTSHAVSMGQSHPQFQYTNASQLYRQPQHTSELRQPVLTAIDSRHYRPQQTLWKPKNG